MDKRIIYIAYFLSLFLLFSCAENKPNKDNSVVKSYEKSAESTLDTKESVEEEEEEEVIEIDEKQATLLKVEKYAIVLNKLNEGVELYKLLSDAKIEESFKKEIKTDLHQLFDDSEWGKIKDEIRNFKLIVTDEGTIKGVFEAGEKKYSTLVNIKTSKQKIEGKEKESVKVYFSDLLLIK